MARRKHTSKKRRRPTDPVDILRLAREILEHGSPEQIQFLIEKIDALTATAPPLTREQKFRTFPLKGRIAADLTIEELAARSGLPPTTIRAIEASQPGVSLADWYIYLRACGFRRRKQSMKDLRESEGLTIEQFARRMGWAPREWRRFEAAFDRGWRSLEPADD